MQQTYRWIVTPFVFYLISGLILGIGSNAYAQEEEVAAEVQVISEQQIPEEDIFWQMLQSSQDQKEHELFLKSYPDSKKVPLVKLRLLRIKKGELPSIYFEEDDPDIWGKFELGAPIQVNLTNDNGSDIPTKGSPTGIYIAGSGSITPTFGMGLGLNYFQQATEATNAAGEEISFQHVYLDVIARGKIGPYINYGFGIGIGSTNIICNSCNFTSKLNYLPSVSLGTGGQNFGVNLIYAPFTASATESFDGEEFEYKWKGNAVVLTFEVRD